MGRDSTAARRHGGAHAGAALLRSAEARRAQAAGRPEPQVEPQVAGRAAVPLSGAASLTMRPC